MSDRSRLKRGLRYWADKLVEHAADLLDRTSSEGHG